MTRINLVEPKELTRQHLIAEYREIVRVFALVRNTQAKGKTISHIDIPKQYVLGSGHVKFFYDKLTFILNRYHSLIAEMKSRNYNVNPIDDQSLLSNIDSHWFNDYIPTEAAILLNRDRINERLTKSNNENNIQTILRE